MIYSNLILIQIIIVYLLDLSGGMTSIKQMIWKWLHPNRIYQPFSFKPFDCSLCMTWWVGLIYIIAAGEFSIYTLLCVAMVSALSTPIGNIITLMRELLTAGINAIENRLWKQ